jgi:HAD superfamily hydrolase (TIGR01509 family)
LSVAGARDLFDVIITLQDVAHPKPHPFPYLKAMIQLGVGPRETVIFEDSLTGLQSAQASGARFIQADWW